MRHTHVFLAAALPLLVAGAALAQGTPAPAPTPAPLPPLPPPAPATTPAKPTPAPAQPGYPPPAGAPAGQAPPGQYPPGPGYPPPGAPYPQGYYPPPYYQPMPPPPGPPPNAHTHSGFFLRMSLGIGYMSNSSEVSGGTSAGKVTARGGGAAFGIDIGGALNPGFILAASFTFQSLANANLSSDTRLMGGTHNPQVSMLALMVDIYPDPKAGFHVGGGLGFAGLSLRQDANSGSTSNDGESGFGFMPHVGYEWWAGNYWGVGVLGRFLYARAKGDLAGGTATDSIVGTSVSFSATYN